MFSPNHVNKGIVNQKGAYFNNENCILAVTPKNSRDKEFNS